MLGWLQDEIQTGTRGTMLKLVCVLVYLLIFTLFAACGENQTQILDCRSGLECTSNCPISVERSVQIECGPLQDDRRYVVLTLEHTVTNLDTVQLKNVRLYSQFKDTQITIDQFSPQEDFMDIHQAIVEYYHTFATLDAGQQASAIYTRYNQSVAQEPRGSYVRDLSACVPGTSVVWLESEYVECN
jgi:hypothetical protein